MRGFLENKRSPVLRSAILIKFSKDVREKKEFH